jgi:NADH-quinone oxidoreductase subunit L
VIGFISVPAALGGTAALERFLAPSFAESGPVAQVAGDRAAQRVGTRHVELSRSQEGTLMLLAVIIAVAGVAAAWRLYVGRPHLPAEYASRWPGVHALLLNRYYVDDFYRATLIRSSFASARGLWRFDNRVVDGLVNAWGSVTRVLAWISHMFDKVFVDGLVNGVGWSAGEGSVLVRRTQTGLVQNYALLIVLGVCAFLTIYLLGGFHRLLMDLLSEVARARP